MNRLKHNLCGAALALLLTVTASAGFALLAGSLVELYDALVRDSRTADGSYRENLAVTELGTPIIVRDQWQPFRTKKLFDLQRQPIELPAREPVWRPAALSADDAGQSGWLRRYGQRNRVARIAAGGRAGEKWYILFDGNRSRRFYFQGMTRDGGETIGYIGRNGFQETKPDEESQFQEAPYRLRADLDRRTTGDRNSRVVLLDDRRLLAIDFQRRNVDELIDEPVVSLGRLNERLDGRRLANDPAVRAVRTSDRVVVLDLEEGTRRTFVIPKPLRDQPFGFYPLNEDALYFASRDPDELPADDGAERTYRREIVRATASGDVTQRETVTLSSSWPRGGGMSRGTQTRLVVVAIPATVYTAGMAFGLLPWLHAKVDHELSFSAALKRSARAAWWVVLLIAALSAWLGWLTLQHQRRHGERNGWFWAAFVFVFGLPGYIGYRLHRDWPHREPIPAPEPTGFEVFAS